MLPILILKSGKINITQSWQITQKAEKRTPTYILFHLLSIYGGIQALELLKVDKKTIKTIEKIMKEEEAFANWLQKNNPRITKLLMKKQLEERKRIKEKIEKTVNTAKDLILNHFFLTKQIGLILF